MFERQPDFFGQRPKVNRYADHYAFEIYDRRFRNLHDAALQGCYICGHFVRRLWTAGHGSEMLTKEVVLHACIRVWNQCADGCDQTCMVDITIWVVGGVDGDTDVDTFPF